MTHWFKAAVGLRIGLARMAMQDGAMIRALDADTFERMQRAQCRLIAAVNALEEFSTRDYAYDRGGEVVSDAHLQEFRYKVWERAS